MTPDQYEPFAAAVDELGLPVRRCVLTGSGVEQAGGTGRFGLAAVYGSRQASVHLDQPPNVESWRALFPEGRTPSTRSSPGGSATWSPPTCSSPTPSRCSPPAGRWTRTWWPSCRARSRVRRGHVQLRCHAPVLAGTRPLGRRARPAGRPRAHRRARARAIGGEEEVRDLQRYLRPASPPGAPRAPGRGPWTAWTDRDHDVVNVERAAMLAAGDDGVPPSMLRLAGLAWAPGLTPAPPRAAAGLVEATTRVGTAAPG